ncbi:MAG: hypothetical protein K0Q77_37 [Anaerosporomusa subterranea]|jgi:hypothetical protein|nr:hypothetical protein [Anaerosporomusa subterranea]
MKPLTWEEMQAQDKQAIDWLLNFPDKRRAYFESMAKMYNANGEYASEVAATLYTGMPKGSGVGRPAEEKAIGLVELSQQNLWIMTIEDVYKVLSPKKLIFLEARRQAEITYYDAKQGRPGWVEDTAKQYCTLIERQFFGFHHLPSGKTVKSWWKDIVNITVRIAQRRGCL